MSVLIFLIGLSAPAAERELVPLHAAQAPTPVRGSMESDDSTSARFRQSLIGQLIQFNGKGMPRSLAEWREALAKHGELTEVPIPFSDSPNHNSFAEPRVVIGISPPEDFRSLNLYRRLYLAVNLYWDPKSRSFRARDLEFISWNQGTGRYDFGSIDHLDRPTEVKAKFHPTEECAVCHRNRGPIFPRAPWSTSTANLALLRGFFTRLNELDPEKYGAPHREMEKLVADHGGEDAAAFRQRVAADPALYNAELTDGIRILPRLASGSFVDASGQLNLLDFSINLANPVLLNQQVLRAIPDRAKREKVLEYLLKSFLNSDLVQSHFVTYRLPENYDGVIEQEMASLGFDVGRLPGALSNVLRDFNPVSNREQTGFIDDLGKGDHDPRNQANLERVLDYDRRRARGAATLPAEARPGDPRAFIPGSAVPRPFQSGTMELDNASSLINVTPRDTEVARDVFDRAVALIRKAHGEKSDLDARNQLLDAFFRSPAFRDLYRDGVVPTRELFREKLVDGLRSALVQSFGVHGKLSVAEEYLQPSLTAAPGDPTVPAHSERHDLTAFRCLPCHTNPNSRLYLPIDPTDPLAWNRWLSAPDKAERTRARGWLAKVVDRLAEKSMPPQVDSAADRFPGDRARLLSFLRTKMR